jgi:hypothetical protein
MSIGYSDHTEREGYISYCRHAVILHFTEELPQQICLFLEALLPNISEP